MEKTYNHKNRYDVKRAGEKLIWRFGIDEDGNTKNFKPNKDDLNALKCLLGYISSKKLENISNNSLFVKLFIITYTHYLKHFNTVVLDEDFNKYISEILVKPVEFYYKDFLTEFKTNQITEMAKHCLKKDMSTFTEKELSRLYTEDFILNKLNETISSALENFSYKE